MNYRCPIETRIGIDFYTNDPETFAGIKEKLNGHERVALYGLSIDLPINMLHQNLKVIEISEFVNEELVLKYQVEAGRLCGMFNLKPKYTGKLAFENHDFDYQEDFLQYFERIK